MIDHLKIGVSQSQMEDDGTLVGDRQQGELNFMRTGDPSYPFAGELLRNGEEQPVSWDDLLLIVESVIASRQGTGGTDEQGLSVEVLDPVLASRTDVDDFLKEVAAFIAWNVDQYSDELEAEAQQ